MKAISNVLTSSTVFLRNTQKSVNYFTVLALFGFTSVSTQAAVITWTGDITIVDSPTVSAPGFDGLDSGDTFSFQFNLDDSVTDTNASSTIGFFSNAVSNFSLWRTGGTGSWDPSASGSWTPSANISANSTGSGIHTITIENFSSGLPTLGGGYLLIPYA